MVDRQEIGPNADAVEAGLTWKAPETDNQWMNFLGFATYYQALDKS